MIDNLEIQKECENYKFNQFSLAFYPELLMSEQLTKCLKSRSFNSFHIEQLFRYWDAKLNEERNVFILPWPDQKYPSVINKEFTREIRSHSISWIAQVVYDFAFDKETFYIAVKIFDLYLQSNNKIDKTKLCYITPAILFIAIQLVEDDEESKRELIQELITTNGVKFLNEVKKLQIHICSGLDFQLITPTAYTWLLFYFQIESCINGQNLSEELHQKIIEEFKKELESFRIQKMGSRSLFRKQIKNTRFKKALTLLDYALYNTESFLYPNPLLAAACFAIEVPLIDDEYEIITGYSKTQLFPCIEYLNDYSEVLQTIKVNNIYTSRKEEELNSPKVKELLITNDNSVLNVDSFLSSLHSITNIVEP
ncbi:hypothetical protein LY90DRAFT_668821 [Neocallimastix californiae]|uniref:Cyclin N-terminal domain-containing protein n=1 Tax=Neocallimastix californiae TaxID=1754190 RepID=A0A1Y2DKQ1_9FUNG|nr:hypothetical protein LY90DRAFT_668821 [Neocallimastix californiae]|eukprot:ORY59858.1 hypothetical protein LY90DRAFT_668821 [Neocallimastix californiae]